MPRYSSFLNEVTSLEAVAFRLRDLTIIQPTWMLHRDLFNAIEGGYIENGLGTPEDLVLFYRGLEIGAAICKLPDVLVNYRYRPQSVSSVVPRQLMLEFRVKHFERTVLGIVDPIYSANLGESKFFTEYQQMSKSKMKKMAWQAKQQEQQQLQLQQQKQEQDQGQDLQSPLSASSLSSVSSMEDNATGDSLHASSSSSSSSSTSSPSTSRTSDASCTRTKAPWYGRKFGIWGSGRDGKRVYNALSDEARALVTCFYDISDARVASGGHMDPKSTKDVKRVVPIKPLSEVKAPFLVCVGLDGTDGALEDSVAATGLVNGRDYYHVV